MSRFKIRAQLASLRDTAQFRDPFGLGWTATVKRRDTTGFKKWLEEVMASIPAYRNQNLAAQKSRILRQMKKEDLVLEFLDKTITEVVRSSDNDIDFAEGVRLHLLDHLDGLEGENGEPVEWSDEVRDDWFQYIAGLQERVPATLTDWEELLVSRGKPDQIELHRRRAEEYSEALAISLPGQPKAYISAHPQDPEKPLRAWDGDTVPFGGQALGNAIVDWLMWCSDETERYRAVSLEAIRGNSETSSDRASVASVV